MNSYGLSAVRLTSCIQLLPVRLFYAKYNFFILFSFCIIRQFFVHRPLVVHAVLFLSDVRRRRAYCNVVWVAWFCHNPISLLSSHLG